MSKSTTPDALVYAESGDVPDIAYWTKALADATQAALTKYHADTGWVDCTIAAGFAMMGGAEKLQARKIGSTVYIRGGVLGQGITAGNNAQVATLPAGLGMAPPVNDIRALGSSAGSITATGFVQTGGEFVIRPGATVGGYYKFDRSYRVD